MWAWPQITLVALFAMTLGVTLAQHGQEKPPHNIGWTLVRLSIITWLLIAGGFFE